MGIMSAAWDKLLQPATLYVAADDDPYDTLHNDELQVLIGGFVFLTFFPLGLVTFFIMVDSNKRRCGVKSSPTLSASGLKDIFPYAILAVWYFAIVALCCSSFSSVWNYSAHSYFMADSPYNLLDDVVAKVSDKFIFKVYKDVVVYYTVLSALVVVGAVAHYSSKLRSFLARRVPVVRFHHTNNGLQRWLSEVFPRYISIGEILALSVLFGLAGYWLYFWRWDYARIPNEANSASLPDVCCAGANGTTTTAGPCMTGADPNGDLQVWARVVGQMSTFFISLTLYPVARNSIWEAVFGISYERAVKVCRL